MKHASGADYKVNILEEKVAFLEQENAELHARVKWFEEQVGLNKHHQFGSSSERTSLDQISLFNEAESESKPGTPEPSIEEVTHKGKAPGQSKETLKGNLLVETVEHTLPEDQRRCPNCSNPLHFMRTEVRKELVYQPAQYKVVEHHCDIFGCRHCEHEGEKATIIMARGPEPLLPKTMASASLVASIIEQKYVQSVPLYRQEQHLGRQGISLSRQTMSNWVLDTAEQWFQPLYKRMREHLLKRDVLHADETTLQVLKEPDRPAESKSYMWMYRTGREGPHIVLYEYQTTRAGKHPKKFLEDFRGFLHTDAYSGYLNLPNVVSVGCWAHARRAFNEALEALPKELRNTHVASMDGLDFCNRLFAIERKLHDVTDEERYKGRLQLVVPVLEEFHTWLKKQKAQATPQSYFGKAVTYCLNQWQELNAFLLDGRLELDNNRAERSIKPFVIGRKNFLFSNTPKGAKGSAIIYSIVETAKENKVNVSSYLPWLLERLPNIDVKDGTALDACMPWSPSLPDEMRLK